MSMTYEAMVFALEVHKDQRRKYTGNPYSDHLAEVAGIVTTVNSSREAVSVSWLHDCVEDQNISDRDISTRFGWTVAKGVYLLSDLEKGHNRAARKAAARVRLADAPGWIQTIKCADLISNTSSIVEHDPKFAVTFLEEARLLLDVMTGADRRIWSIADALVTEKTR